MTPAHSSGAASRSSSVVGQRDRERLGDVERVGVAAVDRPAGERRRRSQRFSSPRRQNSHAPHVWCSHATPTRSPTARRSQPAPSASTVPTTWWPGTTGRCGELEVALDDVQVGAAAAARVHVARAPRRARVRAGRARRARAAGCAIGAGARSTCARDLRSLRSGDDEGRLALDRGAADSTRVDEQLEVDRALAVRRRTRRVDDLARAHELSPGHTCSRNCTAEPADVVGAEPVGRVAARMPACSIPTENTVGKPAAWANSSSWWIGLKSPDAPW